jgi:hypothetical protein
VRLVGKIAAALAMLMPACASAQVEKWHDVSVEKSRAVGVTYARCVVRQNPSAVVEYLADPFGTEDPAKEKKALPQQCFINAMPLIASQLKAPRLLMRGLLFEAVYARDFAKRHVTLNFESLPLQSYAVGGIDPAGSSMRHDYRALMKIGDCAARAAPEKVQALLSTAAGSESEKRAIANFREAWIGCLPGRHTLPFSAEMMRATVVEPFYRLLSLANPLAQ